MEKNRSSKVVAVVALVVAVFGLTLGFAAFSNTLVIQSSATVTPDASAFNVVFSAAAESVDYASKITGVGSAEGVTGNEASITGEDYRTVTGLQANFTAPGQTVTYTFYVHNIGSYIAYLRQISFLGVGGTEELKTCAIPEGERTTQGLVDAACADMSVSVKVGSEEVTKVTKNDYKGHSLALTGHETVIVTIEYANNGNPVDGPMTVTFGDINLDYESVDAA